MMDLKLQTVKYLFLLLASPCWAQLEMRPDVVFDERNDRYDISSLIPRQNRYFDREEAMRANEDYRRNLPMEQLASELRRNVRTNKDLRDFAYHDQMFSDEGGDEMEYNRNLLNFQNSRRFSHLLEYLRRKNHKNRRSGPMEFNDLEKEALRSYVVPVDLKINGYIQAPLVD